MWRAFEKDVETFPVLKSRYEGNKVVPSSLPAISNVAYRDSTRSQDLESRIKLSEQSNKLLLEELMRLQQELKLALRQNEDIVMKERQEMLAIRDKVEAAENMYNHVSMQLSRTEEKVNVEHSTLATLLNQSKELERALTGGQQRIMMKGEQVDRFINRFRDEMSELRQVNEQMQSSLRIVYEDMKNIQHRCEMQKSEFDSMAQEIKQKVKRMETDSIVAMEAFQRSKSTRDNFDGNSYLKQNMESRLLEIHDAVNDIKRKTDVETSERKAGEQKAELNVEKMHVTLHELEKKFRDVSHTANLNIKERENAYEVERDKLTYKIAELTEEINKKALDRERQLRDEAQIKFTLMEKRFREEHSSRQTFERSVRDEMEKTFETVKVHLSEELQNMRHRTTMAKTHDNQQFIKMNDCLSLLEKEIEAAKKAFEDVLHAEIIARQQQNEKTLEKCDKLQEKINVAITTLQQAISGVTTHTDEAVQQAKDEILTSLYHPNSNRHQTITDINERLTNLNNHVTELDEALKNRSLPPSTSLANLEAPVNNETTSYNEEYTKLNKRMDEAYKWQENVEDALRDLYTKLHPMNGEISKLKVAIEDIVNELELRRLARLASINDDETKTPISQDENLNMKVEKLENDIEQISIQMEKLENTVNTIRTVLSQKISSEAKTVKEIREMFADDIGKVVKYFIREQRRVFVKYHINDRNVYRPEIRKDGEKQAHSLHLALLSINRWGVYEAYRIHKYKQAWFKIVENKNNRPVSEIEFKENEENQSDDDNADEKRSDDDGDNDDDDSDDDDDDDDSDDDDDDDDSDDDDNDDDNDDDDNDDDDDDNNDDDNNDDDDDDDDNDDGEKKSDENKSSKENDSEEEKNEQKKAKNEKKKEKDNDAEG